MADSGLRKEGFGETESLKEIKARMKYKKPEHFDISSEGEEQKIRLVNGAAKMKVKKKTKQKRKRVTSSGCRL